MAARIAGTLSLIAFACCLMAGVLVGDNTLETAVLRALVGLGVTFIVGFVVGLMAERMVRESLDRDAAKLADARRTLAEKRAALEQEEIPTVG